MSKLIVFWFSLLTTFTCFAGQNISKVYTSGERDRNYTVHLPTGYQGDKQYPLVMVLHGCKQTNDIIQHDSEFDVIADAEGFIVVYPFVTSYPSSPPRNKNCWGYWLEEQRHRGGGEAGDLAGVVAEVSRDYAVDSDRVHVTGLSSGGGMTTIMMATYPDVFASGAPVAGLAYGETSSSYVPLGGKYITPQQACTNMNNEMGARKRNVPVFLVHSTTDNTVYIKGAEVNRDAWGLCFDIDVMDPTYSHSGNAENTPWRHKKYGNLEGRSSNIETFFVDNKDHGWVGGQSGEYADANGPVISQYIWEFFSEHPLSANKAPLVTLDYAQGDDPQARCVTVQGTATDTDGQLAEVWVALQGKYPKAPEQAVISGDSYTFSACELTDNAVYIAEVTAKDDQGAVSQAVQASLTVGTPPPNQAPVLTATEPVVSGTCVAVDGAASDDSTVTRVEVNTGSGWQEASLSAGAFSYQQCGLAVGNYQLEIRATDDEAAQTQLTAGNFSIDQLPWDQIVEATLTSHVASQRISNYPGGVGYGTFDTLYLDLFNQYGNSTAFTLYELSGVWYQLAENIPPRQVTDKKPLLSLNSPVVTGACVSMAGSASDDKSLASVSVAVDSGTWQGVSLTAENWSLEVCSLSDGVHNYQAKAVDDAGQETLKPGNSFTVGNLDLPPTITLSQVLVSGDCINVNGSASDDNSLAAVNVKLGTANWQSAVLTANQWQYQQCGFAAGSYEVRVEAVDSVSQSTQVMGENAVVGGLCQDSYDTNYNHVANKRASTDFLKIYVYTKGSKENLGFYNVFVSSWVKETSSNYFEAGQCQ